MPKRKSDVLAEDAFHDAPSAASPGVEQPTKKARASKASSSSAADASSTSAVPAKGKGKGAKTKEPESFKNWREIELEGEDDMSE